MVTSSAKETNVEDPKVSETQVHSPILPIGSGGQGGLATTQEGIGEEGESATTQDGIGEERHAYFEAWHLQFLYTSLYLSNSASVSFVIPWPSSFSWSLFLSSVF